MIFGESKSDKVMRWILFLVFVSIFAIIAFYTIREVFGDIKTEERDILFRVFMVEVGLAVLLLFRILSPTKNKNENRHIPKMAGKYKYEMTLSDNKAVFQGECTVRQKGYKLSIDGERKKAARGDNKENISVHWYSNWAELCLDGRIRLDYQITENGGIRGYAVLEYGESGAETLIGESHLLGHSYDYATLKLKKI